MKGKTMSNLMLDVDQAGELKAAFRRCGYNNAEIKKLSTGDFLAEVRNVLRGLAEIKPIEHAVDFGADPFLPAGCKVEEHQKGKVAKLERKGDDVYLDGKKIEFWLSSEQKRGVITGNTLRAKLAGKPVLNANMLDYLLKNPHLIPEVWKKDENGNTRYVFFWGTVYRSTAGNLYVRCLYWFGGRWDWYYYWLDFDFVDDSPAAVSAS
jgi:hypothetical protein